VTLFSLVLKNWTCVKAQPVSSRYNYPTLIKRELAMREYNETITWTDSEGAKHQATYSVSNERELYNDHMAWLEEQEITFEVSTVSN
jgi:hypothetical protein